MNILPILLMAIMLFPLNNMTGVSTKAVFPLSGTSAVWVGQEVKQTIESGAGAVYKVSSRGTYEKFTVCVDKLAVKDNPGDNFPVLSYLHRGEKVTIYDRSRGILGWAMIAPAVWVKEAGLCR